MLPRENRLKRDKDFQTLFKSGQGVYGSICGAKWQKNKLNLARIAVVVGTKVSKKAVVRNRLRRQVREVVRLRLDRVKPGYDLVLIVSKDILGKEHSEIEKEVIKTLKKTQVYG